jgi:predicted ester cyclase
MSVETNKALVRRVFDEGFNRGDLLVVDELVASTGCDHQHPDVSSFTDHLKAVIVAMREAMPDLHFEISEIIGEGEWVALHSVMSGTNTGPLRAPLLPENGPPMVPPTGKSIRVPHMHMIRMADGKGVELFHLMDTISMLGQLGMMSVPSRV